MPVSVAVPIPVRLGTDRPVRVVAVGPVRKVVVGPETLVRQVLPKNIWLYVSQIPNLAKLGTRFVLQGGTQHNLAAVKSQVDFIESRFVGTGVKAEVTVHAHCGESGAIGCGLEARRMWAELDQRTQFIGMRRCGALSTAPRAPNQPAATSVRTSA